MLLALCSSVSVASHLSLSGSVTPPVPSSFALAPQGLWEWGVLHPVKCPPGPPSTSPWPSGLPLPHPPCAVLQLRQEGGRALPDQVERPAL